MIKIKGAGYNPQTALQETYLSNAIIKQLNQWNVSYETGWAETGIVATIEGTKGPGHIVAARADIDALPILENSGVLWGSQNVGMMHACGHDGHASILLSVIYALNQNPDFKGSFKAIFQPAEETTEGAKRMIEEGLLEKHKLDFVYALHNWPALPQDTVAVHEKEAMACSDYITFTINGTGGHCATPHKAVNPIDVSAALCGAINNLKTNEINPFVPFTIVPTISVAGGNSAKNIITETGKQTWALRTFDQTSQNYAEQRMHEIACGLSQTFRAQIDVDYKRGANAMINDPDQAKLCYKTACDVLGEQNVLWNPDPELTAEDFGSFLEKVRGAYFWYGQQKPEASPSNFNLHNSQYDFNDDIIPGAAEVMARLVEARLALDAV